MPTEIPAEAGAGRSLQAFVHGKYLGRQVAAYYLQNIDIGHAVNILINNLAQLYFTSTLNGPLCIGNSQFPIVNCARGESKVCV